MTAGLEGAVIAEMMKIPSINSLRATEILRIIISIALIKRNIDAEGMKTFALGAENLNIGSTLAPKK